MRILLLATFLLFSQAAMASYGSLNNGGNMASYGSLNDGGNPENITQGFVEHRLKGPIPTSCRTLDLLNEGAILAFTIAGAREGFMSPEWAFTYGYMAVMLGGAKAFKWAKDDVPYDLLANLPILGFSAIRAMLSTRVILPNNPDELRVMEAISYLTLATSAIQVGFEAYRAVQVAKEYSWGWITSPRKLRRILAQFIN